MTDIEADLAILTEMNKRRGQKIRELTAELEKARADVCRMCRLASMAHKIVTKCSTCSYKRGEKNEIGGVMQKM